MAIKFEINVDGERVALVDTVEDFEKAIDTVDRPIIAPDEVAKAFGTPEVTPHRQRRVGSRLAGRRGSLDHDAGGQTLARCATTMPSVPCVLARRRGCRFY